MNITTEGWIDTILQFDFATEYLPGDQNILADALSRSGHEETTGAISVRQAELDSAVATSISSDKCVEWEAIKRGKMVPNEEEKQSLIESIHGFGQFICRNMISFANNSFNLLNASSISDVHSIGP